MRIYSCIALFSILNNGSIAIAFIYVEPRTLIHNTLQQDRHKPPQSIICAFMGDNYYVKYSRREKFWNTLICGSLSSTKIGLNYREFSTVSCTTLIEDLKTTSFALVENNIKSQVADCNSRKFIIIPECRKECNFVAAKNFLLTPIQFNFRERPLITSNLLFLG